MGDAASGSDPMLKRKWIPFVALIIFGALCFSSVSWGVTADDLQKQIDQTRKKLSQTKVRENSVLNRLVRTQQELNNICSNLERLNSNLGNTERRIATIKAQLTTAENELNQIKDQIGGRKGVLDERLVAIYKYGYQSFMEVLFTAKNFPELITRFEMVSSFVKGDIQIIKALQSQRALITQKRVEIAKKQKELENQKVLYSKLQDQTKRQQTRQLSVIRDQKEELAQVQQDRKLLEESIDRMEEQSKQLEAQIRDLSNKNGTSLGTGKMIWPVPDARITSYFGWRVHPILKKRKYHSGLDLAVVYGTPIKAADNGVIIFSGRNGDYGNMIAIDHGSNISTVYGHCSVLIAKVGQKVTKGDVIAKVGSTGLSTGPHLHFEVRKNGVPVNPLSYL